MKKIKRSVDLSWEYKVVLIFMFIVMPLVVTIFIKDKGPLYFRASLISTYILIFVLNYEIFKFLKFLLSGMLRASFALKEIVWLIFLAMVNIHLFAILYFTVGIVDGNDVIVRDLYTSYYFSIVTWTTLGYGDYSPAENYRLTAAVQAILGYIYMAILLGIFVNVSSNKNIKTMTVFKLSRGLFALF